LLPLISSYIAGYAALVSSKLLCIKIAG